MSGNIFPTNEAGRPLGNDRGSSTRMLLLILLLVAAAAGYLYFFTDLITPHKEPVSAPPQPAQVTQPLPPRPGPPEAAKPGQPLPAAPAAVGQPEKPAPVAAPAKVAPEQTPAPAAHPVKAAPAQTEQAKVPVQPAAAKPAAPAAPAQPKPAVAAPAPGGKKAPAAAKPEKKMEKQAVKKKGGKYRLLVGDFAPDKELASVEAKLKKSGIAPVRKTVVTAVEPMNRLFVARFADQADAEAELGKVKKITGDAFLIADTDGYLLYAGSFLYAGRADAVKKKLASRGVTSVVRQVKAPVRVTRVTAGSYASKEDAGKDVVRLKKQGIRASVIKLK